MYFNPPTSNESSSNSNGQMSLPMAYKFQFFVWSQSSPLPRILLANCVYGNVSQKSQPNDLQSDKASFAREECERLFVITRGRRKSAVKKLG